MISFVFTQAPEGGDSGFQVTGMIEWERNSRPKKIPRASNKTPKKSLDQKLTPHAKILTLKVQTLKTLEIEGLCLLIHDI